MRWKLFNNRSRAIQKAVQDKLERLERNRLAEECAKLDTSFEKAMADEGLFEDLAAWPKELRGEIPWADLNPTIGREESRKHPVRALQAVQRPDQNGQAGLDDEVG